MAQSRRILILGGGFGGVYCAKELESRLPKDAEVEIVLISEQNFLVFTPMLPQVISGMIESNHVVVPIRQILKRTKFQEASITSIDVQEKRVSVEIDEGHAGEQSRQVMSFDHLVVALGSATNFAGMPRINDHVFVLKNLKDALKLRNHIIDMLERADITADKTLRARLLNFVVVGGGLSGIETAAELNSFLRKAIKYYPNIDSDSSSTPTVTIVQSRDRILPEFALTLAEYTLRRLVHDGISIILNSKVVAVENGIATVSDRGGKETAIETATVIWTAGIAPIAVTSCIPGERSSSGRLQVDGYMRVRSQQDIWAIGDCALLTSETSGDPLPATAQYAIREAELVASNIAGIVKGSRLRLKQFRYDKDAQMAVIGDKTAIARMAGRNVSGFWVWCLWRIVYLNKLPMLKKRLRVLFDWTVDIFFDPDLTHLRGLEERKNQKSNRDIRHAESS